MSDTASPAMANDGARDGALGALLAKLNGIPDGLIALLARIGIAGIFFKSGLTKVMWDGGPAFSDSVQYLFEEEYALPLLPWDVAAVLAASAELLLPPLLILGLATRLSALALLGMTVVIQVFVYPNLWDTHATWAAALVFLIARGAGPWSLDHLIARARGA
ncbi:MAG: DoxX family protein [Hyphomicrobiales bacterium]|nr:DoxX family protein [Hyphomicrobiales bacterium]MCP5371880.1 DoxX family protein [Hyphomicrobiales bacterium]